MYHIYIMATPRSNSINNTFSINNRLPIIFVYRTLLLHRPRSNPRKSSKRGHALDA
jgi:hypothetical protein